MMGTTHAAAGLCAAAFVLHATGAPPELYPLGLAAGAAAALLPDMDEPRSTVNRYAVVVGPALGHAIRHRTVTHSLAALVLLGLALRGLWPGIPQPVFLCALAGFASHLLADLLTPEGVMLLWPLLPAHVSLTGWLGPLGRLFATGGPLETVLVRPGLALAALWLLGKGLGVI